LFEILCVQGEEVDTDRQAVANRWRLLEQQAVEKGVYSLTKTGGGLEGEETEEGGEEEDL
jgi:hypothetical protein